MSKSNCAWKFVNDENEEWGNETVSMIVGVDWSMAWYVVVHLTVVAFARENKKQAME
jgi:hypothetical protein